MPQIQFRIRQCQIWMRQMQIRLIKDQIGKYHSQIRRRQAQFHLISVIGILFCLLLHTNDNGAKWRNKPSVRRRSLFSPHFPLSISLFMDFQVITEIRAQASRVFSANAWQKMSKTTHNGRRFCYVAVETLTQSVRSSDNWGIVYTHCRYFFSGQIYWLRLQGTNRYYWHYSWRTVWPRDETEVGGDRCIWHMSLHMYILALHIWHIWGIWHYICTMYILGPESVASGWVQSQHLENNLIWYIDVCPERFHWWCHWQFWQDDHFHVDSAVKFH